MLVIKVVNLIFFCKKNDKRKRVSEGQGEIERGDLWIGEGGIQIETADLEMGKRVGFIDR